MNFELGNFDAHLGSTGALEAAMSAVSHKRQKKKSREFHPVFYDVGDIRELRGPRGAPELADVAENLPGQLILPVAMLITLRCAPFIVVRAEASVAESCILQVAMLITLRCALYRF